MSKRARQADAAQIARLRRLQAADALARYQEADRDETVRQVEQSNALARVQSAAGDWQACLASGVFRPDFARALAGSLVTAEAEADEADSACRIAAARMETARQTYALARSAEEGAAGLAQKLGRRVRRAREERQLSQLEDIRARIKGRPV